MSDERDPLEGCQLIERWPHPLPEKFCRVCEELKPLADFYERAGAPDGRRNDCKECLKSRMKSLRDAHPERNKAQCRSYHRRHRDRLNQCRDYYRENAEWLRAYARNYGVRNADARNRRAKAWREANPDRARAMVVEWRKNNPERNAILLALGTVRYRRAEKRATPAWADRDAMAKFYEQAREATRRTGIVHHVDHIVPLQSEVVCGLNNQFNLQVLPWNENISKGNRTWPGMPT